MGSNGSKNGAAEITLSQPLTQIPKWVRWQKIQVSEFVRTIVEPKKTKNYYITFLQFFKFPCFFLLILKFHYTIIFPYMIVGIIKY